MKIIKKIDETDKHKTYHKTHTRRSARAFVHQDGKILVTYLGAIGEYKIPGGGVEPGETIIQALEREVLEETGHEIEQILEPIGKIIHIRADKDYPDEIFEQINYYYLCKASEKKQAIKPSENEIRYEIESCWEDIDKIIMTNKRNLHRSQARFSVRELFMFEYFKQNYLK